MEFKPRLRAFFLAGKADFADIGEACEFGLLAFPEAFSLPGVGDPLRIHLDGMPCVDKEKSGVYFQLAGRENELAGFYERCSSGVLDQFAISPDVDPGLFRFAESYWGKLPRNLRLIHFSLRGPYTFGLMAKGEDGAAAFYNDTLRDLIVKQLAMKIRWRETKIKELFPGVQTMVVLGEPSLSVFTSAVGCGSWEAIKNALSEVLDAVQGISCIHCCSNFDWPLLMDTGADCINFDAYQHGDSMCLYPHEVERFLLRGGSLAWGIVPTANIARETPETIVARLEHQMQAVVSRGVDRQLLLNSSWITPSCAPGLMSRDLMKRVYSTTDEVSRCMVQKYYE